MCVCEGEFICVYVFVRVKYTRILGNGRQHPFSESALSVQFRNRLLQCEKVSRRMYRWLYSKSPENKFRENILWFYQLEDNDLDFSTVWTLSKHSRDFMDFLDQFWRSSWKILYNWDISYSYFDSWPIFWKYYI